MELIEGAALQEHISSLKERNERFGEERIWGIFVQIIRALNYLHKEKKIIHRDLSANNIMLSDNDKVTISKIIFFFKFLIKIFFSTKLLYLLISFYPIS